MTQLSIDQIQAGDELPTLSVDVTPTTVVLGALASRDWRPMHHDKDFAVNRNGTRDIFLNTPNQAAWFERYVTDWTGATGRLGKMQFRMRDSVFPGDTMVIRGKVTNVSTDDSGCAWADLDLAMTVNDKITTSCKARVAVPSGSGDNPWKRRGSDWQPNGPGNSNAKANGS